VARQDFSASDIVNSTHSLYLKTSITSSSIVYLQAVWSRFISFGLSSYCCVANHSGSSMLNLLSIRMSLCRKDDVTILYMRIHQCCEQYSLISWQSRNMNDLQIKPSVWLTLTYSLALLRISDHCIGPKYLRYAENAIRCYIYCQSQTGKVMVNARRSVGLHNILFNRGLKYSASYTKYSGWRGGAPHSFRRRGVAWTIFGWRRRRRRRWDTSAVGSTNST